MTATSGSRRVVIVGGGFAGLFAARALRRAPVQVTLIDRAEHHLFQPLLYQCSTGILSEGKIAIPLRELLRKHENVEFVLAEVTGLDAAGRTVTARRPLGEQIEFGYDCFLGWWAWLFIHIGFLTGFRNRVGAIVGWWFAFARDLRRERTFTVDDTPVPSGAYGDPGEAGHPADTAM